MATYSPRGQQPFSTRAKSASILQGPLVVAAGVAVAGDGDARSGPRVGGATSLSAAGSGALVLAPFLSSPRDGPQATDAITNATARPPAVELARLLVDPGVSRRDMGTKLRT